MRYDDKGNEIKDFVLNQKPFNNSKILITEKILGVDLQENMHLGHYLILELHV